MTELLSTLAAVLLPTLSMVALMVAPPKYLPSYRRGGWGKFAR